MRGWRSEAWRNLGIEKERYEGFQIERVKNKIRNKVFKSNSGEMKMKKLKVGAKFFSTRVA